MKNAAAERTLGNTVECIYLDWDRPLVPAAAAWLLERAERTNGLCVLARALCVVPGKRSGRVLLEELVRQCRADGRHLSPPRIITPGSIWDELYQEPIPGSLPRATEHECILAWMRAIAETDRDVFAPLLPRAEAVGLGTGSGGDVLVQHELAQRFYSLHRDLAGEMKSFHDAAEAAIELDLQAEAERWRTLASLHETYESQLEQCGLMDPFRARHAAHEAVEAETREHEDTKARSKPRLPNVESLVLIGIAELNASQRAALAPFAPRISALVHAPNRECDHFDEHGCVIDEYWRKRTLEIPEETILVADTPSDQARAAIDVLAELGESETYATDEITIGLGDAGLAPALDAAARWAGCAIHHPDGTPAAQIGPLRLLSAIADWLSEPRFEYFAALLRHPDLKRWLRTKGTEESNSSPAREDWLSLLDVYFAEHLNGRLTGEWLGGNPQPLRDLYEQVNALLKPLRDKSEMPLPAWSDAVRHVLKSVYGTAEDNGSTHTAVIEACLAVQNVLVTLESAHEALLPHANAANALHLILREAQEAMIPEPMHENDIEALGWLELHLDPAPALVVLGVNEGNIPHSTVGDAFLPDSLRTKLGMQNNARRFARDAYLLEAIVRSRPLVKLIAGRRDSRGEPLMPSRLLVQCERDALAGRVRHLTDAKSAWRSRLPRGVRPAASSTQFIVPAADPNVPIPDSFRVTAFRTYLACPFRFWLRHVLGIEAMEDHAAELDPMQFGSLAHDILQDFGRDESIRDSDDAEAISAYLGKRLDDHAKRNYGSDPVPAVRVQLHRLHMRLDAFAQYQATLRHDGWKIEQAEYKLPESTVLDVPDDPAGPMRIRGKIDRIDRHEHTGTIRIIDYKTSESVTSPMKAHRGKEKWDPEDDWIDLQLPLYRHLLAQHGYEGEVEVGYLQLPSDPAGITFDPAPWDETQIDDAIERAREIIRCIRRGEFERDPAATKFDEFANILHLSSFRDEEAAEPEGAAS